MEALSMSAHEAAVVKAAQTLTYTGGATSVVFGLTPGEWQVIGVIGGLVAAFLGLLVTWGYKHAHYKLAREMKAGLDE